MIDPELMRISQAQSQSIMAVGTTFDQGRFIPQYDTLDPSRRGIPSNPTSAPVDSRLQNVQCRGNLDYPSPSTSSFEGLSYSNGTSFIPNSAVDSPRSPPPMPPPIRGPYSYDSPTTGFRAFGELLESPGHQAKRQKRSHSGDSPSVPSTLLKQELALEKANGSLPVTDTYSPNPGPLTPYSPFMGTPLTPSSSVASEDASIRNVPRPTPAPYAPPDLRRLSVNSLLTGPPGETPPGLVSSEVRGRRYPIGDSSYTTYGFDLGHPDLDTPKNDDANAILILSPPTGSVGFAGDGQYDASSNLSFRIRSKDIAFEKGGYYAKPVPIKISKSLEPLPTLLLENPMNLLYFHHFLNHTARILVPHDCEQNPFRNILPKSRLSTSFVLYLLT
jgi:hypothetical protein